MADATGFKENNNVTVSHAFKSSTASGYMWIAPQGTTLPDTVDSALTDAFKGTGFISEDGLVEPAALDLGDGFVDSDGENVANADPSFNKTWTGSFIEAANVNVITALFGSDHVTVDNTTGLLTYDEEAIALDYHVIVIDELWAKTSDFPLGRRVRHVMPHATIAITDDITHNSTTLVSYGFTVTATGIAGYPPQRTFIQIPKTGSAPSGTRSAKSD